MNDTHSEESLGVATSVPASGVGSGDIESQRILNKSEGEQIIRRILSFVNGAGRTRVALISSWTGELRWARNRVSLASDRRFIFVGMYRRSTAALAVMSTNQLDDESLRALVAAAERQSNGRPRPQGIEDMPLDGNSYSIPNTDIWSDTTYNNTAKDRTELANVLMSGAETQGMLSAGYMEMLGSSIHQYNPLGSGWEKDAVRYDAYTQAQCSMTVRHPKGVGSGWAGLSSYDWSRIDGGALAQRALDKCVSSLNAVAIEPGRYTVILEPQAVVDLASELLFWAYRIDARNHAENGQGPFVLGPDHALQLMRSKLGMKVLDERVTITHDPVDPLLGVLPLPGLERITWFERGVLKTLSFDDSYGVPKLRQAKMELPRDSFRMAGENISMEEMISTTKRGLIVTRFFDMYPIDQASMLCTAVTRDGLWLVENGKITKAVKNMRITESPFFVFNQIEQLGTPVPVFRPTEVGLRPAVVPPVKARDFSFTSMVDAV